MVDRWVLESTDGPIEHAKTRCLNGHVLTPLTAMLASAADPAGRRPGAPAAARRRDGGGVDT
jgi:hypothetical protein